ncbi:AIPR family protein [Nocardia mikamii]|uniref:AIPR family protein n=1 Tax=Nocardia mikamii TaxID=508464 RepID=UPI0007A4AE0D|nr:AIPR family protein [Nocardia mikamii]
MAPLEADTRRQVTQVREQLHETFDGLIDDSDIANLQGPNYENRYLSRALAALAVRRVAKCSAAEAASFVTDGIADQGLDAIAPLPDTGRVLFVQAKWSNSCSATFDVDAAKAMIDGLNRIDEELYSQFNQRAADLAQQSRSIFISGHVVLVIALMGAEKPQQPALEVLKNAFGVFGRSGARFTIETLYASDFHEQIHEDLRPTPISLEVRLDDWYQQKGPYDAYQGSVAAESVADWFEQHGIALFEHNLRAPLGTTTTNATIGQTLTTAPGKFWYLNNGITMICNGLTAKHDSARSPQSRPTTLSVNGASIVNGAQTVRSIARAMHDDGEAAANAMLSIKVINTQGDKQLAVDVSQAANRQNAIEQRDHIALEPVHQAIKANLRAELRKHYVVKRGELVAAPDTGCSLDELGLALACLHPDADHSARANSSTENLWEQGPTGSHTVLFKREPSPLTVWRSVLTLRATRSEVHRLGADTERRHSLGADAEGRLGREASIAEHGGLLITHLIFQFLGGASIGDPDFDWDSEVLEKVPALVPELVRHLAYLIEQTNSRREIRALFRSSAESQILANQVLEQLADGFQVPVKPAPPRKPRRQNTVPLLVDRRVIKDGTPLRFVARTEPERLALIDWLAADERRGQATWVNHRSKSILWTYDSQQYSASGLVTKMWIDAGWDDRPVANQGTVRWQLDDGQTLLDLAQSIHREDALDGDDHSESFTAAQLEDVLMGKLLTRPELVRQAMANSKEQFMESQDFRAAVTEAVIDSQGAEGALAGYYFSNDPRVDADVAALAVAFYEAAVNQRPVI